MLESDIVITNPPFSLFRDFSNWLLNDDKKFIIIGREGAVMYRDYFSYILDNKVWPRYTKVKEFLVVNDNNELSNKKFGNIGWWTNIEMTKRNDELHLFEIYNSKDYD